MRLLATKPRRPTLTGLSQCSSPASALRPVPGAPVGSAVGARFCVQMRRDGFARLLLGPEQHALYAVVVVVVVVEVVVVVGAEQHALYAPTRIEPATTRALQCTM